MMRSWVLALAVGLVALASGFLREFRALGAVLVPEGLAELARETLGLLMEHYVSHYGSLFARPTSFR